MSPATEAEHIPTRKVTLFGRLKRHGTSTASILNNNTSPNADIDQEAKLPDDEALLPVPAPPKSKSTSKKLRPFSSDSLKEKDEYYFTSARLKSVRRSSMRNCKLKIGAQKKEDVGKLTVVLDVDETLIHSRMDGVNKNRYRQEEERKEDARECDEFVITMDDGDVIHVNKRPGLDEFLRTASEKYEIMAYTAGLEQYARPLLDWLDPTGTIFRHRLYRDSCLFSSGFYVKDLEKVNRDMSRTVLVDNNAYCFLPQLSNGIPISSFYDDPNDDALTVLQNFLQNLEKEEDVRPMLNQTFNLSKILKEHRAHVIG